MISIEESPNENLVDHREDYIHQLFGQMMSQRINELLQKGDPPFAAGGISYGDFVRGYEALTVGLLPNPAQEVQGLGGCEAGLGRH